MQQQNQQNLFDQLCFDIDMTDDDVDDLFTREKDTGRVMEL